MNVPYDYFVREFLLKISEFDFINLQEENRTAIVDGYMKRSFSAFKNVCKYDFQTTANDENREFDVNIDDESELTEIADIVSEGMVVQWFKPYVYKQELLELNLNTRDFSTYSPAELLRQVGSAYEKAQKNFIQMIREYSYNHGKISELHL